MVYANGLCERYELCYAELQEVPSGVVSSCVELKPTSLIREHVTLYIVPNSAEINT